MLNVDEGKQHLAFDVLKQTICRKHANGKA